MGITKWGIKAGRAIGKDPNKKGDFGEMIVAIERNRNFSIKNVFFGTF